MNVEYCKSLRNEKSFGGGHSFNHFRRFEPIVCRGTSLHSSAKLNPSTYLESFKQTHGIKLGRPHQTLRMVKSQLFIESPNLSTQRPIFSVLFNGHQLQLLLQLVRPSFLFFLLPLIRFLSSFYPQFLILSLLLLLLLGL